MSIAEKFRRICDDRPLREWLDQEAAASVKYLTVATDTVLIHRAQGQLSVINRLVDLLDAAQKMR